jgi:flagellar protein FliS
MREGELYLKSNLEGMNNDELILFIYQETLKILNQVMFYFEKNNIEKRVSAINKCIEILNTLISILNFDAGGEIAVRLRSLYLYSIKKLTAANYDKDPRPVEEVIRIFKELYSGWSEKIEKDRKNNASASAVNLGGGMGTPMAGGYGSDNSQGLEIYG